MYLINFPSLLYQTINIALTVSLGLVIDIELCLITYILIFSYPNSLPEADGNKSAPFH